MSTFWTPCWSGSASVVLMKAMKAKGASNPSVIKTGMNGFLECMVTLHPFGVATGRHVPETVWAANRKDQILCLRAVASQSMPSLRQRRHSPGQGSDKPRTLKMGSRACPLRTVSPMGACGRADISIYFLYILNFSAGVRQNDARTSETLQERRQPSGALAERLPIRGGEG